MPDDKFLDVTDLDAGYGRSQVLFGVSLEVPWRGAVAILGRNGAGKTTLMKALIGELPLLGGSVQLEWRDTQNEKQAHRARQIGRAHFSRNPGEPLCRFGYLPSFVGCNGLFQR